MSSLLCINPLYPISISQKSATDDGIGKLERPHSLRLSGVELAPLQSSTPQGEELPSQLSSPSSNMVTFTYFWYFF